VLAVGGTPETVGSLSLGDVVEHKERWFTPDNTVVVLSGSFSDKTVERATSLFGALEDAAPRRGDPSEGVGPGFVEEVGVDAEASDHKQLQLYISIYLFCQFFSR